MKSKTKKSLPEKREDSSSEEEDRDDEDDADVEDDDSSVEDTSDDDDNVDGGADGSSADDAEDESDDQKEASSDDDDDGEGEFKMVNGTADSDSDADDDWMNEEKHATSLKNLQKIDPEFYKYLEENDKKLLQFHESDKDDESDEGSETHELPDQLQVDSEESDFEPEDGQEKRSRGSSVTLAQVEEWRSQLINEPSPKTIGRAIDLFHAALDRVTGEDSSEYNVDGSAVFNAVIEMCVMHLQTSLVDFLKLTPTTLKAPSKAKKWVKVRGPMNSYFVDLFKLMNGVASEHILSVMLKHLHSMCSFVTCFQKISRVALKNLTKLWSTGEETVRVLAFLCIVRLTTGIKSNLLNSALKLMYIAYIRGSKFVSANTLPQINFMKRCLVDMYKLDPALSYQHAFLYIRQLAIHLRNAVTIHKKESFQTVYNWQYVHSLRLWVDLLCAAADSPELQQLSYPVVQITLGCVKLIPTAQYLPLRFHCLQLLTKLARETSTFIPVLPLITESLTVVDLNKHHKKATMKPFDFTFILRVSKAAMAENGFTDAVIENVFQLIMEYSAAHAHSIAFPDLVVPLTIQLKNFLKNCSVPKYSSKLKLILTKLNENYTFVNNARNTLSLSLHETSKINAFETELKTKGPPLAKFWDQLSKSQNIRRAKQFTNNDKIANERMNLPKIIKRPASAANKKPPPEGPVELFPSDESDFEFPDVDDEAPRKKQKRSKDEPNARDKKPAKGKGSKKKKAVLEEDDVPDQDDIVEELDVNAL
ncbi:nucleolar complex protein 2 [Nesidiocoris tenuis]|uniref:Nucleolar complex protein 2 n=1 Tax=Nesidiocoris tenuis TaxID=355587 RepID=A0ABN7A5F7_9HEMI|nr:nucleolar complex protein 2 [Nesidiocoris tenuis]